MFSRRLATFLLGIWMGCCMLVDALALEGHRVAARILDVPILEAKAALTKAGEAPIGPLLHHLASEQVRAMLETWGAAQLLLAVFLLLLLALTDQRKILAVLMAAAMGLLASAQHFGITPDLNILGRSADFLPETASFSTRTQIWTLTQLYGVMEIVKLLIGGVLASYFFAMESTVKRSKSRRTRADDEALSAQAK
jgi:hypothetical protein